MKLSKEKEHMELNPYTLWLLELYFIFKFNKLEFNSPILQFWFPKLEIHHIQMHRRLSDDMFVKILNFHNQQFHPQFVCFQVL